jgi:hypothetical protein
MAIQSASAKLYTGIRCWCVDKNISASLSAPVTVVANVRRLKRTVIDLVATATVSLTNERYRAYGAGNVVNDGFFVSGQSYKIVQLNPGQSPPDIGDSDWNAIAGTTGVTYAAGDEFIAANNGSLPEVAGAANDENATTPDLRNASRKTSKASLSSWTARSNLVCDFPTYIRIDIEKLGLPEGTDCIVQFEEDWIIEDRGRLLPSGGYEYPNNTQGLGIPRNDNYVQFRVPYYGLSFMTSAFTAPGTFNYRRRSPGSMAFTSAFSPVISAQLTARGITDLQSRFTANIIAGEIVRLINRADFFVVAGRIGPAGMPYLEGNGFPYYNINGTLTGLGIFPGITRIRPAASVFESVVSSVSVIGADARLMAASMSSSTAFTSEAIRFKGPGSLVLSAAFTTTQQAVKTASGRSTMTSSFSMSISARTKGSLKQTVRQWSAIAAAPNGDVWATVRSTNALGSGGGGIYVKYSNSDTFTLHTNLDRLWTGIAVGSNGDVWASHENPAITPGGGIYYKLSASSTFVQDTQAPNRMYQHIAVNDFDGSVYVAVGDPFISGQNTRTIYRRLGPNRFGVRASDSANIGPGSWDWRTLAPFGDWAGVATKPGDEDVWFSTHGGDVYRLNVSTYTINEGSPDEQTYYQGLSNHPFSGINLDTKSFQDIAWAPNGDLYAATTTVEAIEAGDGYIWKLTGGVGSAFTAVTSDVLRTWTGITVSTDGIIYACVFGGDIYIIDYL